MTSDEKETRRAQRLVNLPGDCRAVSTVTIEPGRQIDNGDKRSHSIRPSDDNPAPP